MGGNLITRNNLRAQVTIFVIIAILIVGAIAGFFIVRSQVFEVSIPPELSSAYDFYIDCLETDMKDGASLLGSGAGYIEPREFDPGSPYAPFSSELDFLGLGIPYWYYISGNGIVVEQVPSKEDMGAQLSDYLEEQIDGCDFSSQRNGLAN